MSMYRAARVCVVVVAAMLALAGCGGSEPTPTDPATPTTPAAVPTTTAAAAAYSQSDVDGAILRLDDLNLSDFHPFTFPDPAGGMPPRSADCYVKWQRQHRDQRESGTFSAGQSYAQNDDTGPFIIQSASVQAGTGAKDLIAAQRASYAGACPTWKNTAGKTTYTAAEDTALGSFGDETYGYKVTANGEGGLVVILVGVMIRKGTLLSTVEYAGSPTINETRAKAIFAAAAKLLPQT
jgi:hypothetical protein